MEAGVLVLGGSSNQGNCYHRPGGTFGVANRVAIVPQIIKDLPRTCHSAKSSHTYHPLLLPIIPLATWFGVHYAKTGHVFGSPEFFQYNVAATLNPLRIPLAFVLRLWQVIGYMGLYLLTLAGLLALSRNPQVEKGIPRPRIAIWQQAAFAAVLLAYLLFMSAVGGAVLARYLLPVVPLVILVWVATLWRRVRYWTLIVAAVAIAFVAALFTNPPYGFSLEDNLAYRDYIVLHAEASRFLSLSCAIRTFAS